MSFRRRLTLFFLLIVVLPMVAVGVLVIDVSEESTVGQVDARLGAHLESALTLHEQHVRDARSAADALARSERLGAALAADDPDEVEDVARDLARRHGATSVRVADADGDVIAEVLRPRPFASSELELTSDGERIGVLEVSTASIAGYLSDVDQFADHVVIADGGGPIRATLDVQAEHLPAAQDAHDIEVGDRRLRAAAAELPDSDGLRVVVAGEREEGGFLASSPRVAAALLVFFAVAMFFVVMLTRSLHGQVATMLDAARRIGEGDFSRKVPVVGRDEMAGLASEFNKMSDRLSAQMDQLRRQRIELERSVRRIGEAFAAGLDRAALLRIVVETAISACEAEYGILAQTGRAGAETESGEATPEMRRAALAAEERSVREGGVVEEEAGDAWAICGPLLRIGRSGEPIGAMTLVRRGRAFDASERDVFRYLLGQAAASVENLALHEQVSEQAVTDELTGLANSRAFREAMEKEAARAQRFGHELSVLLLDIDDFKRVNDTYGHLQGDEVLRVVGRVLTAESRGVDEPARYGGEEFAVALPETDAEGAVEVGERIRSRLEAQALPLVDGTGEIRVTASLGAATLPGSAEDVRGLIAAADEALYEAKRAGKNRVQAAKGRTGARRS